MKGLLPVLILFSTFTMAAGEKDCLPKQFRPSGPPAFEEFARKQYEQWLAESGEPCLYDLVRAQEQREVYRFTWGGSKHYLEYISVRLEVKPDGTGIAYIKARERPPAANREETPKDEVKPVSKESVTGLLRMLGDFWLMPFTDDVYGHDGSGWDLEGVKDGNFHKVSRWSPKERDKRFHRIGEYFLYKIANVKLSHSFIG